ncbi:ScbR family autoregulator-binding transcription factor [Streptomyces tsukubensis]|uniref:TetR family transcriptional regulator n=1 Tax=Streptomyces tsukubensis TaxID=83656 RepID=A0A1V4A0H8_9ACTN|nr:ScbR family autoregulator-binding transcription factor [Streptomyces tsukubensis]OON72071.1 TetR family transcriptional regulator [Streptomyces tsukubensis]QFR93290.1 TetR family transcriptional regulator [Streptomyces tsukubensis]
MAKQDRAVRTRRRITEAAAEVFEREGYQAATITEILRTAGVTKGALYFHFQSKEDLAQAVLHEQRQEEAVRPQEVRLQELVDGGLVLAHRLAGQPLVRASIRLTLDPYAQGVDRRAPFRQWTERNLKVLLAAEAAGELLPHVDPAATAELCVASFAGLQFMSQVMSDYGDLSERLSVFQHHLMPSIATPYALAHLDLSPERGRRLVAEAVDRGGEGIEGLRV